MEIVKAIVKDAESYKQAVDEVAREGKWLASSTGYSMAEVLSFMKYCLDTDSIQLFLKDEDRVVGWCDIVPARGIRTGSLGIGICEGYRGKGYGSKLMNSALSMCEGRFETVVLHVREDNARAVGFYLSNGFIVEKIYREGKYKKMPNRVLMMTKRLTRSGK